MKLCPDAAQALSPPQDLELYITNPGPAAPCHPGQTPASLPVAVLDDCGTAYAHDRIARIQTCRPQREYGQRRADMTRGQSGPGIVARVREANTRPVLTSRDGGSKLTFPCSSWHCLSQGMSQQTSPVLAGRRNASDLPLPTSSWTSRNHPTPRRKTMTVAIKYAQIQSPIEQRRDRANWTRQGPSLVEIGWKNQGAYRCGVAPNRCDCAGSPSTPPKNSVAEKNPQPRLEHWTCGRRWRQARRRVCVACDCCHPHTSTVTFHRKT